MLKNYLKIKEAAELLGVSQLTLRNWDKKGKLPAHRHPLNNYRIYHLVDLERFLEKINKSRPRKLAVKLIDDD